ncbi:MAG: TylF/MycF/NovP-related O-methyltransferase [Pseudomonadota bacterium]
MRADWMMSDKDFAEVWDAARLLTMTSPERGFALWRAVEHVARLTIPGAFVECGCWRGGSAIVMARAAQHFDIGDRPIFLFDTFDGMTEASDRDRDILGRNASDLLRATKDDREQADIWAHATLETVRDGLARNQVDLETLSFIIGDVRITLKSPQTGPISILRLDTDFYDSTLMELEMLYPLLVPGGILIIDDYGHWEGAKAAFEDYFSGDRARYRPFLNAVDYTGRVGVKLAEIPV